MSASTFRSAFIQADPEVVNRSKLKDIEWLAYLHLEDIAGGSRLIKAAHYKLAERLGIDEDRADAIIGALYRKLTTWAEDDDAEGTIKLYPRPRPFIKVHTWLVQALPHRRWSRIFYRVVHHHGPGERVINFTRLLRDPDVPHTKGERGNGARWRILARMVAIWEAMGLIEVTSAARNAARRVVVHQDVLDAVTTLEQGRTLYREAAVHHTGTPDRSPCRTAPVHPTRPPTESKNPESPAESGKKSIESIGLSQRRLNSPGWDLYQDQEDGLNPIPGCDIGGEDESLDWHPGLWDDPEDAVDWPSATPVIPLPRPKAPSHLTPDTPSGSNRETLYEYALRSNGRLPNGAILFPAGKPDTD
jgi:hypothetical protein